MSLLRILCAEVSHAQLYKICFMTDLLLKAQMKEKDVVFPEPTTEDLTQCADWYVVSGEQLCVDKG